MKSVTELLNDIDIAVAAWHEDGVWSVAEMPDAQDLPRVIDELRSHQTNGGAIGLLAIDEEFFIIIRVLGSHTTMFLSDVTTAIDYECAADFLDMMDLPSPDEEDDAIPVGDLDLLADLGMNRMELETLCDDPELFPDEQLEAIAKRLGFGAEFSELLEL